MSTPFPIIKTERLLLRQFLPDDLNNVYHGLSHPDVIRYYGVSYHTLEATKEQMAFYGGLEREGTGIWWAISDVDNQTFFGAGGLNNLNKTHHKAEIGFWLLPSYWGMGMMKEAMPLICQYGFETLGLHRIEAFVETENLNCKKAMSKLNFTNEGTMRECEIKDGKYISLDIYSLLNNR